MSIGLAGLGDPQVLHIVSDSRYDLSHVAYSGRTRNPIHFKDD
jgi:hypothetical protein